MLPISQTLSDIRNHKIGFIFQGFNLIPNLDALGNVELPLIYRGLGKQQRKEIAGEALSKVGLENRMDHRPNQLSGGQQQRVAVARAIAAQRRSSLPMSRPVTWTVSRLSRS